MPKPNMQTPRDVSETPFQVFTPTKGDTLTSPFVPSEDMIVKLGADVTITLNSIAVTYNAGDVIGLIQGISYTLSASTAVHEI